MGTYLFSIAIVLMLLNLTTWSQEEEILTQNDAFDLISLQPAAILESFINVMKFNGLTQIQVIH